MTEFTLDTLGVVFVPQAPGLRRFGDLTWEDLSPFAQGYVEAMFASLRGDLTPEIAKALAGIAAYDRSAISRPLLRDRHKAMRERCTWSRTHDWPSICDMMREVGLLTVVGQEDGGKISEPTELGRAVLPFLLGFYHLHPEALAMILGDCEAFQAVRPRDVSAYAGKCFWAWRQAGEFPPFPPLTVLLNDDGKVCLKERD